MEMDYLCILATYLDFHILSVLGATVYIYGENFKKTHLFSYVINA